MSIITSKNPLTIASLAVLLAIPGISSAEIVDQSRWLVRAGDTVYSIARQVFPGDTRQQARFRKQLISANPEIFSRGARHMKVGVRLKLPESMISDKKPLPVKKARPVKLRPAPIVATRSQARTQPVSVTRDPQQTVGAVITRVGGKLQAENRGSRRNLDRHSDILKGDTISTSDRGHTQIRMKDGALIYLRPNTRFKVEEYSFNGREDGTEKSVFELISGGFQTITGLIGHKNKQNYQVRTSVATMGIRGTHYGLMLCDAGSCADQGLQDGLYGGVVDGSVVAENDTGIHQFNNDQYFYVASASSPATETLVPPPVFYGQTVDQQLATTAEQEQAFQQLTSTLQPSAAFTPDETRAQAPVILPADLSNSTQNVSVDVIAPPTVQRAADGSGMLAGFTYLDDTGALQVNSVSVQVPGAAGSNEMYLDDFLLPSSQTAALPIYGSSLDTSTSVTQQLNLNRQADGSGGTMVVEGVEPTSGIVWGRWTGNYTSREDGVALNNDQNLHFVYSDNLTPSTNLQAMTGTSVIYNQVAGAGSVTDGAGIPALSSNVTMDVNFTGQQISTYGVNVLTGTSTFDAQATAIPFNALDQSFALSSGGSCSGSCQGEASVAFVGNAAESAMTSFSVTETGTGDSVSGTAVLAR